MGRFRHQKVSLKIIFCVSVILTGLEEEKKSARSTTGNVDV